MEVLQRTANRGSISTGYDVDNSVKLEADNTEYLNRVIASGGNRKTWTISAWVKRTEISDASHGGGHTIFGVNVSGNEGTIVRFNTGTTAATLDTIQIDIGAGGTLSRSHTSQVFRDTSAWYHIVLAVDTTQSTATDRFKLYVNGELVTSYYSRNNPAQNFDTSNNQADNSCTQHIGAYTVSGTAYGKFCGYIAEVNHVDGAALAPTAFGEVDSDSGIWKPKAASPTYGTNGFFLDFADSGNLGDDESGNGLDFTEVNIAAADQATDTPTNSFATGNPLVYFSNPPMTTFNAISEGATQFKKGANGWETMTSSIAVTSGKWYIEIQNISVPDSAMMGITPTDSELIFRGGRISYHMGASSGDGGVAQYGQNGTLYKEGVGITYSPSPTWVGGTTVQGIALDMDNGKVYFAKDNTWMNNGDPTSGSTGTGAVDIPDYTTKPYVFGYSLYANNHYGRMNFGGYTSGSISSAASDANGYGTFEYAPPTGYYALCTKNLAEYG
jgi:hypothetical protein